MKIDACNIYSKQRESESWRDSLIVVQHAKACLINLQLAN